MNALDQFNGFVDSIITRNPMITVKTTETKKVSEIILPTGVAIILNKNNSISFGYRGTIAQYLDKEKIEKDVRNALIPFYCIDGIYSDDLKIAEEDIDKATIRFVFYSVKVVTKTFIGKRAAIGYITNLNGPLQSL